MSSLAASAAALASKGRHGDTMLVHMNPIEVAWMDSLTPGGLTENPDTGQPEAFAFLLPLLAGVAGPSIMGALGLSGMGALAGSAALTGLADYAINKDPGRALGSGLLSFGLGGLSGALGGGANAANAAAQTAAKLPAAAEAGAAAVNAATQSGAKALAAGAAKDTVANSIAKAALNAPTLGYTAGQAGGSVLGNLGKVAANPMLAVNAIRANPMSIGLPLAAGLAGSAGAFSNMPGSPYRDDDERYRGDYARERFPGPRTRNQFTGDYSRYGIDGGEFDFFTPNNDRRVSPPVLGESGLGAYTGMAMGGPVYGGGDGVTDDVPAMGPGGRPIMLSDGEYVVPADVVSMLGRGSTNGGVRYLDQLVSGTRAKPPRVEKGAPPRRKAA